MTPEKLLAAPMSAPSRRSPNSSARSMRRPLDALVIVGDDQHELFQDSMMPSLGDLLRRDASATRRSAKSPEAIGTSAHRWSGSSREHDVHYPVHAGLALHMIIDLTRARIRRLRRAAKLAADQYEGHAYSYIHRTYLERTQPPVVPILLNTYYPPNPRDAETLRRNSAAS